MPTMIPLSAQSPEQAGGAQRDLLLGQPSAERFADVAESRRRAAPHRAPRPRRPSWSGSSSADLPPQQPRYRLLRRMRVGRRLVAAHRLPHGTVFHCRVSRRSEGWNSNRSSLQAVGVDGGERRARYRLGVGRIEDLRQRPLEQCELRENRLLRIGRDVAPGIPRARCRTSGSSDARTDARRRTPRPARRSPHRPALRAAWDRCHRALRSAALDRHCGKCRGAQRTAAAAHRRWRRRSRWARPAGEPADPAAVRAATP